MARTNLLFQMRASGHAFDAFSLGVLNLSLIWWRICKRFINNAGVIGRLNSFEITKNLRCNVGLGLELPSVFKLWLQNIARNSGLAMIKTFDLPWWRTCKVRNCLFPVDKFPHHRNGDSWKPVKLPALTFMFQATSWGLDSSSPLGQNQGVAACNGHKKLPIGKAAARPGWS